MPSRAGIPPQRFRLPMTPAYPCALPGTPGLTLEEIARYTQGRLVGDGRLGVSRVVRPEDVRAPGDLALVLNAEAVARMRGSPARIAFVAADLGFPWEGLDGCVLVERPRFALALLLELFARPQGLRAGIHPSAVVEPSARISPRAAIGPLCYVGAEVVVAEGVRLLAQVTLGTGSQIGADSVLHPGVRIGEGVRIGCRVTLYPNACIGADGFSFATAEPSGIDSARATKAIRSETRAPRRIPSIGGVVIEDDVEVGAGATIDRGTVGDTLIRRGTKIDNLVMVGHNSLIGEDCLIAGQSGISGSCLIGDRVAMGGQVGIADHMRIGNDVVIAASSGVSQHIPDRSLYIDTPAIPYARWQERYRGIGRLKRLLQEVRRLGERLRLLERVTGIAGEADGPHPPWEPSQDPGER